MASAFPASDGGQAGSGAGTGGVMDETRAEVTVRYWAAARQAAGCAEERLRGDTVADVLAAARERHDDPGFAKLLGVCSLLLGDRPLGRAEPSDVAVGDGDVLEVLPPFAGG